MTKMMPMLTSTIKYEVDKKDWNKQIQRQSFTNAYQMANFYAPHCGAFNSEQFYITVQNSTGEIVGQLTGIINDQDSSTLQGLEPIITWNHGPIIHDYENSLMITEKILSSIDQISRDKKINLIKGSSSPLAKQISNTVFDQFNYSYQPWITYITSLNKTSDEMFLSLHNKTRYDVRKGEKINLKFEVIKERKELDEYSELKLHDSKNKNKILTRNKIFRDKRWELSIGQGWEKVYFARLEGSIVGGMANFVFNNNVVQHTIANSDNRKLFAGSFLTWNVIKWSIENHYNTYDMGGANPNPISTKEEGIKHFKSKWNGDTHHYFLYTKMMNKMKTKITKAIKQPSIIRHKFSTLVGR